MTILAGVFSRRPKVRPDPTWAAALRSAISRNPSETIESFQDDSALLFKTDSGAFGSRAFNQGTSGSISMLAGDPLLRSSETGAGTNRKRDLEIIHGALDSGDWNILKSTQGSFVGVYYQAVNHRVYFIADRLGLRPLYYWLADDWVVYATALRILETLPFVPKVMDVRAITEAAGFSYSLGSHTPYVGVKTIKAAEIVSIEPQLVSTSQYWRWDAIPVSCKPESELLDEVYQRFNIAIRCRLRGDRSVVSFLSGGLDSRCVVGRLTDYCETVYTLNFSLPSTQDRVYGAEMARRLGTIHHEEDVHPEFQRHLAGIALTLAKPLPVQRPRLIWSGDGGSVGLGHVYLVPSVVELLRQQNLEGAIAKFLHDEGKQITSRLLQPGALKSLSQALRERMREEFSDIHCEDPGRNLYVFLLVNDQRRHLAWLFEDVDVNPLEFVTPFFDGDFLSVVASVPLDLCLLHRFYNKWLSCFSPDLLSVPWQVYPGHDPCPVPPLPGLVSQFDRSQNRYLHSHKRLQLIRNTSELLRSDAFPEPLLSRRYLRFAYSACRWGLRDYFYVLDSALVYARYWRISQGKYELPSSPA
jgi:hypothetical protein